MMRLRQLIKSLIVLSLLIFPMLANAQQSERFGEYEVHYSALPTGMLNNAVAQQYGIVRSRTRGMIMLTVMRDNQAVPARIEVLARDPDDNLREIPARQVKTITGFRMLGLLPFKPGSRSSLRLTCVPMPVAARSRSHFARAFPPAGKHRCRLG